MSNGRHSLAPTVGQIRAQRTASMFSNSASDLLGLIADAIIGIDRDGVIVFWGSGAEAMLGYAPDEAVGRTFTELLVPMDRVAEQQQSLREVFTSGVPAL